MKHIFTCLALISSLIITAQNSDITGSVTDQVTKEPIAGASVKFDKGRGLITDASGNYKITISEGQYDIAVSSIGYKKQKLSLNVVAGVNQKLDFQLKTDAFEFNEVVSVSQYKKNAAKENVSTLVVSQDYLKHTNANNLNDALAKMPGVVIQDNQITIRSGSSYSYGVGSRVAVLQDGLALSSADLGQAQTNMAQIGNAKQIEVIKGASSVVYGSSALNGVVNIITDWPTEDTGRTSIDVNAGVYGAYPKLTQKWTGSQSLPFFTNINVNHRRRIKDVQLLAGGNFTAVKSYLQGDDNFRVQGYFKTRYISPKIPGLSLGVNGSIQYEAIDEFFLNKDADSLAYYLGVGSSSRYVRLNVDPHLTYSNAKGHTYKFQFRYLNINRIGNGADPNAISHQIIWQNQYIYKWHDMLIFTTGLPINVGISRSNLYDGTHPTFFGALYEQIEFNYKRLNIQAGVRYEIQKVDAYVEKGLPVVRAGINYQVGKATFLRASWGQGYRIPSIGERDILQSLYAGGILVIPNDTLHPEKGWALEIGANQGFKIGKNFQGFVDLAIYWNSYQSFTQYDFGNYRNIFPGSGKPITTDTAYLNHTITGSKDYLFGVQAHNLSNTQIFGYEVSVGARGTIGKVGIRLGAGYNYNFASNLPDGTDSTNQYKLKDFFKDAFTYMGKRIEDQNSNTYKNLADFRSRHTFRVDLELSYWRVYVGTNIAYGSFPEKIPDALNIVTAFISNNHSYEDYYVRHRNGDVVADVRMGYKVSKTAEFGFIIKNVANSVYMTRPGRPEPIRNYTLQFRYNF